MSCRVKISAALYALTLGTVKCRLEYRSAVQWSLSYRLTLNARLIRQYSSISVLSMSLPFMCIATPSCFYLLLVSYQIRIALSSTRFDPVQVLVVRESCTTPLAGQKKPRLCDRAYGALCFGSYSLGNIIVQLVPLPVSTPFMWQA